MRRGECRVRSFSVAECPCVSGARSCAPVIISLELGLLSMLLPLSSSRAIIRAVRLSDLKPSMDVERILQSGAVGALYAEQCSPKSGDGHALAVLRVNFPNSPTPTSLRDEFALPSVTLRTYVYRKWGALYLLFLSVPVSFFFSLSLLCLS